VRRTSPVSDAAASAGEALKWRRLLPAAGKAPDDYGDFDRAVRSMLNRISTENSSRLLPLDPGLRGAAGSADSPQWWAVRFSALMLSWLLEVIHTNRCARGLAMRSADNVLPEYLEATAPLLERSPRLLNALVAWVARHLRWDDFCWPATRLLLLASRDSREQDTMPRWALGRLPAALIRGRIMAFLVPPRLPRRTEAASGSAAKRVEFPYGGQACGRAFAIETLAACTRGPCEASADRKDVVAVLAHLVRFAPAAIWPRLSAFAFSLAEAALAQVAVCAEDQVFLAASILVTVAQRVEAQVHCSIPGSGNESHKHGNQDLGPLRRLAGLLRRGTDKLRRSGGLSQFVDTRIQAAFEHVHRAELATEAGLPGLAGPMSRPPRQPSAVA